MMDENLVIELRNIAVHLKNLGWGKADSIEHGAIEDLSEHIKEAADTIAGALDHVAEAIEDLTRSLGNSAKMTSAPEK